MPSADHLGRLYPRAAQHTGRRFPPTTPTPCCVEATSLFAKEVWDNRDLSDRVLVSRRTRPIVTSGIT